MKKDLVRDRVMWEDLEMLASADLPFSAFIGKKILVTGATGLLGSQLVKSLLHMNAKQNLNLSVIAMVRNEEKAHRVFEAYLDEEALSFLYGDITGEISYHGDVDFIIHAASATSSKFFVEHPVETIDIAINGTKNVLNFAKEKQPEAMVYLSSLEVYGTPDGSKETISESDYGYIEPLSVRSSYSEGKRMVECLCASYASEYQVPVKVVRLSQTFGPGVEYNDGRVFAEFARSAIEGKDIVLHTQGNTVRTYCYGRDAVAAILIALVKGEVGEAYNITNIDTKCSIREMGELVCGIYPEKDIHVVIDIPENVAALGYNPEMKIALDTSKLNALGWKATVGMREMFERLIESMKISKE